MYRIPVSQGGAFVFKYDLLQYEALHVNEDERGINRQSLSSVISLELRLVPQLPCLALRPLAVLSSHPPIDDLTSVKPVSLTVAITFASHNAFDAH